MPRFALAILVLVLAVTATTCVVTLQLSARIDGGLPADPRVRAEVYPVSSMVYVTIVTGEIPGDPPIPTSITVTTNCEDENGCAAAHRVAVERAASGLINVTYSTP